MANSRTILKETTKPTNNSRGKGLILETPYHPGFVDDKDLETVKMAVDKELADISNAFYETTERTADTITRIDKIEIEGDGLLAKIEEVDKVSKEGDIALAQRITTLTAESEAGDVKLEEEMKVVSDATGKLEAKWGIQMDVNGKVSGVTMNNDGATSEFNIVADKFRITDGVSDTVPFEVVGGHTRINSAYINSIQSDNWDGTSGWAITRDGWAHFNNVTVKGTVYADAGYFSGELRAASGTFSGTLAAASGTFSGALAGATGDFTGWVNANGGSFNNVTIEQNCVVRGTIYADRIVGDVVRVNNLVNGQALTFSSGERSRHLSFLMIVCSGSAWGNIDLYVNGGHQTSLRAGVIATAGGMSIAAVTYSKTFEINMPPHTTWNAHFVQSFGDSESYVSWGTASVLLIDNQL